MFSIQEVLIFALLVTIIILLLLNNKENYAWSCTFTPNKDYYKEDWILGNNPGALALARDNIKY
jgi:hypothetical protein